MVLYKCYLCNFESKQKNDYSRHLNTKKHQMRYNESTNNSHNLLMPQIGPEMTQNDPIMTQGGPEMTQNDPQMTQNDPTNFN